MKAGISSLVLLVLWSNGTCAQSARGGYLVKDPETGLAVRVRPGLEGRFEPAAGFISVESQFDEKLGDHSPNFVCKIKFLAGVKIGGTAASATETYASWRDDARTAYSRQNLILSEKTIVAGKLRGLQLTAKPGSATHTPSTPDFDERARVLATFLRSSKGTGLVYCSTSADEFERDVPLFKAILADITFPG